MLHFLRSSLATLGILIGVMAVIWLVAWGEGVSYQIQQQINELGARNIIIKSVKPADVGRAGSFIFEYGLKRDDYARIVTTIPTVERAVPMREISREVRFRDRKTQVQLIGCTPEYFEINNLNVDRGRLMTDRDLSERDNAVIIGVETAQFLFPFEAPIGRKIMTEIDHEFYTVIGVTQERDPSAAIGSSFAGRDYNMDIYMPLTTFRSRIGDEVIIIGSGSREGELVELNQITVTVENINQVEETAEIIETLLEKFHKERDYSITIPKELLKQAEVLRTMFNVLLVLIAGISLLVGGVGIMNIMLATVTERTREIGIRRAMGAKQRDIVAQFLAETIVLTSVGGVLGVIGGFACGLFTEGVQWFFKSFLTDMWEALPATVQDMTPIIAPWSVVAAFSISVAVGVIFGIYPAMRASKMDPIEALRHE